jgi:hypothetical protein
MIIGSEIELQRIQGSAQKQAVNLNQKRTFVIDIDMGKDICPGNRVVIEALYVVQESAFPDFQPCFVSTAYIAPGFIKKLDCRKIICGGFGRTVFDFRNIIPVV